MKCLDLKRDCSLSIKILFSLLFLCIVNAGPAKAEVRIVDEGSGQPLGRASVFDKNGVFIAVADDEGYLPQSIPSYSYPLNIRYVGYVPLTVTSPDLGTVTMLESSYTLPEVVVDDVSRNILYLQAYVRSYSTIENAKDTMASFKEQVVDYAIPVGKAKYKGWKKPRVLAQQQYEYLKIDKKKTSLDTLLLTDGGKFRSNNFNITQKFTIPESILSGDSTVYVTYGKYFPEEKWSVAGNYYIFETDGMADYKDHYFQPGFLKLFGLTVRMTMDERKYVFEKGLRSGSKVDKGANVENLVEASENFDLIMKGKMIKKATEQNEDTKLALYSEMFITERAYLTADEAKELKKDAPVVDIARFKIPEGIPAPPEEVLKLKEAVLKSVSE